MKAHAKINLALVVGPPRDDGKHEIVTVYQRLDLADEVTLGPPSDWPSRASPSDTIVRRALEPIADAAGVEPRWRARIDKRIPVAAGLGGGSSDAAAALLLANERLQEPLPARAAARARGRARCRRAVLPEPWAAARDRRRLDAGADRLAAGLHGRCCSCRRSVVKESTGAVYARFDG